MAEKKQHDNFMRQDQEVEWGYFEKRRKRFNDALEAGFKSVMPKKHKKPIKAKKGRKK